MFSATAFRRVQKILAHFTANPLTSGARDRIVTWRDALLSPQYTQTSEVLHRTDGSMCCLGVACNLTNPEGWAEDRMSCVFTFNEKDDVPDAMTLALYGMDDKVAGLFAELNDDDRLTFEEISQVLDLVLDIS